MEYHKYVIMSEIYKEEEKKKTKDELNKILATTCRGSFDETNNRNSISITMHITSEPQLW